MVNVYVNDFSSSVQTYYRELKDYKPLTKEEEKKLFRMARLGDKKARNKILESNLKFVFDVTKRYKGCGVALEDLISEGNIGLTKAFDKFDETRDNRFISYAIWWIRQAIQECIKKRSVVNSFEKYDEEVLNIKEENIQDDGDDDTVVRDTIHSNIDDIVHDEISSEHKHIIEQLMRSLTPRAKYIISSYYGLNGKKEKNLEEIGEELKLSKERVRQIKLKALKMMRSEILMTNYSKISFRRYL